jgi:tRNA threonylcarbamoyladenosine biosynthesis protein TsaB
MKLLLIDSNPNTSFIGHYTEDNYIVSKTTDFLKTEELTNTNKTPDKLIHCLDYISNQQGINLSEIDVIAVTIGPGSFTGIRVGLAIAKGVADSLNKKIIPVNNFILTLNRLPEIEGDNTYCVLIEAKLPEYYYSIIKEKKELKSGFVQLNEINSIIGENVILVGDFSNETMGKLSYFRVSSLKNSKPETEAMAELSKKLYESGIIYSSGEIKPLYIKDFILRKHSP